MCDYEMGRFSRNERRKREESDLKVLKSLAG
jgi:hypothetical protein